MNFGRAPLRFGTAAVGALLVLLPPADAEACAFPVCEEPRVSTSSTAPVPSNVPALPFHPGWRHNAPVALDPADAGIVLTDTSGAEVALAITSDPDVPGAYRLGVQLRPGETYRLRYRDPCAQAEEVPVDGGVLGAAPQLAADAADAGVLETTLTTASSSPAPTTAGWLRVVSTELRRLAATSECGTCTRDVAASVVTLGFTPSEELTPYLPVTRVELWVDGALWTRTGHGEVLADGGLVDPGEFLGWRHFAPERRVDVLFSACAATLAESGVWEDRGVTAGPHSARLRAVVPGVAELWTGPVDVALDCTGWEGISEQVCSLLEAHGGSGADAAPADGGTPPADAPPAGCGGCGTGAGAGALVPAALLLVAARLRRNGRGAHSPRRPAR